MDPLSNSKANRHPIRVERPPLTQAVFEMRFSPAQDGVGDLLPGLMFSKLGDIFSIVEPAPIGIIPREIRKQRPELRYLSQFKLQGKAEALLIGDNVLGLAVEPPYPGWQQFKARCTTVGQALHATGLVDRVERFSLKYVNALLMANLDAFKIEIDLAGYAMKGTGFRLRFETESDGFTSIVECNSGLATDSGSPAPQAVLFAIDTIYEGDLKTFWGEMGAHIDGAHRVLEDLFFGLLTRETIEGFGPVWSEK